MTEDSQEEKNIQSAMDKCEEILSEFMEAGIIIGTFIDDDGHTRKWSQSWGNDFTVSKIVEVENQETCIAHTHCTHAAEDDDD